MSIPEFAICLVGLGLHSGQITREAESALSRCRRIFFIHPSSQMHDWVHTLDSQAVDLSSFYQMGKSRIITYRAIAATVTQEARTNGPAGLALYGHPLILSTLSQMVLAASDWLGLESLVVPGISSIDTVVADLRIDPGEVALQIQEATDLLLYERPLDIYRGLLLFQPSYAGTWLHTDRASEKSLSKLVDYLALFYSAEHEVILVRSASESWTKPDILRIALADLGQRGSDIPSDFTLYVPPVALLRSEVSEVREFLNKSI